MVTNFNAISTIDTINFLKKSDYNIKTEEIEKKRPNYTGT